MARIRDVKPDFFLDEEIAYLPPITRLFFIGLWTVADREGRLEDRPARIKVQVLPYDPSDVTELLDQLEQSGFILRYEVDGRKYIQIRSFAKHQSPHPKEQPSKIPGPSAVRSQKDNLSPASQVQAAEGNVDAGELQGTCRSGSSAPSGSLAPGGDASPMHAPEQEQPDAGLTPHHVLHVLSVVRTQVRPDLGLMWAKGRFADRDAREFCEQFPAEQHGQVLGALRGKGADYFLRRDHRFVQEGYPAKGFFDLFNALRERAPPAAGASVSGLPKVQVPEAFRRRPSP